MSSITAGTTSTTTLVHSGDTTGSLVFKTNDTGSGGTTAVTIDTSQNVGIGTTSPLGVLDVASSSNPAVRIRNTSTGGSGIWFGNSTSGTTTGDGSNVGIDSSQQLNLWNYENTATLFATNNTERMRIDSSGNLCLGTTSTFNSAILALQSSVANNIAYWKNSNAAPYGFRLNYSTATPNNTDNWFYYADDATALRFKVTSNGGIYNYSANNSNLSDQREKKDIALAPNYLNKICQIPVKTFLYNDQTDTDKNLGVIAQDVQSVCPELVMESNWADKDEPEKMRLSIYQTDLQYALMKSIQELKTINDTQAEKINALTARIVALESK